MDKKLVTLADLHQLALPRVQKCEGCSGVKDIAIEFDQDGEWFIAVSAPGETLPEDAQRAAAAVRAELDDRYSVRTD